jgi:hypothetical protein
VIVDDAVLPSGVVSAGSAEPLQVAKTVARARLNAMLAGKGSL